MNGSIWLRKISSRDALRCNGFKIIRRIELNMLKRIVLVNRKECTLLSLQSRRSCDP